MWAVYVPIGRFTGGTSHHARPYLRMHLARRRFGMTAERFTLTAIQVRVQGWADATTFVTVDAHIVGNDVIWLVLSFSC